MKLKLWSLVENKSQKTQGYIIAKVLFDYEM